MVDEKTFTQVMSHYDQDSSGGISETEFEGMYRLRDTIINYPDRNSELAEIYLRFWQSGPLNE
eukprot:COSAG01_NODE_782_length_13631_cov_73.763450_13_plen_63_part_00